MLLSSEPACVEAIVPPSQHPVLRGSFLFCPKVLSCILIRVTHRRTAQWVLIWGFGGFAAVVMKCEHVLSVADLLQPEVTVSVSSVQM